jgi:probable HAF family extracellular repeat protein
MHSQTGSKPWKSLAAVGFGLLLSIPGLAQAQYTFYPIDVPGATRTAANGNSTNKIVGEFDDEKGTHCFVFNEGVFTQNGFVLNKGDFTQIDAPGADATVVSGVNALGQLAGFKVNSDGTHGFFKGKGDFIPINAPGSNITLGFFINALGQVVGTYRDANQKRHGFIWRNNEFLTTSINFPEDASPAGTSAVGINDIGEVVGTYVDQDGHRHGFRRSSKGDFARFDVPDADFTVGQGINNAGTIAGLYVDGSGPHGFVLKNPVFMTGVLNGVFMAVNVPDSNGTQVFSINAKGEIVGDYFDSKGEHGFLGVPTAEGHGLTFDPGVTSEGASKGIIFH